MCVRAQKVIVHLLSFRLFCSPQPVWIEPRNPRITPTKAMLNIAIAVLGGGVNFAAPSGSDNSCTTPSNIRLQKGPAERGHVKKRQKVSKSFSTLFDKFRAGQKTSKIVKKRQQVFRHFSTIFAPHHFFRPLLGGSEIPLLDRMPCVGVVYGCRSPAGKGLGFLDSHQSECHRRTHQKKKVGRS